MAKEKHLRRFQSDVTWDNEVIDLEQKTMKWTTHPTEATCVRCLCNALLWHEQELLKTRHPNGK